MDHISTSNPQAHSQYSEGSATIENLFPGLSEYASLDQNEDPNYDFLWENNTNFPQSDQQQSFAPQNNNGWAQNHMSNANETVLPHYESLRQQSSENNAYPQSLYGARPASQNQFDPRSFSRPSHSPTPYNAYAYQQPMTLNSAPSYASSSEFAVQSPHAGARRSPLPPTTFSSDLGQPQYISPYGMRQTLHPGFPNMQMGRYGNQTDQDRRQPPNVVDPRFLNPTDFQTSQLEQVQNQFQNMSEVLPNAASNSVVNHQGLSGPHTSVSTPPLGPKPMTVVNKTEKSLSKPRPKKDPNAPKRPRGRPRKDGQTGTKPDGSVSGSTDDSDSDDLVIEQAPEPMPAILIPPRPDQIDQRLVYEACLAVWSPRNLTVPAKKVSEAVKTLGELLKGLRDQWKTRNELLKRAELANTPAVPSLKADVAKLRQQAEIVTSRVTEYGHPSLLAHLGNNPYTLSALQSFLLDRVNAGDNDGTLITSILKLMKSFTSMTIDLLAKTKNDKILVRLTKKAASETKALGQAILDNAAAAEKRKVASTTSGSIDPSTNLSAEKKPLPQAVTDRGVEPVIGTKRPNDQSNLPSGKRPAVPAKTISQASKPLALQNAAARRSDSAPPQKPATSLINGTSATIASKPKPPMPTPAPKPTANIFSALSAAKKPGTSNAARAAAAAKEKAAVGSQPKIESPPPSSSTGRPSSVAQPTFSFAQTLAGLNKPKEVETKKMDDSPQETEEERTKRLRKESRKKLRVSWKPDASLTDIRIFEHHPDEEIGQTESMRRDVDDVGGEGRMLKLHKDMDDLDEDEESRANGEELAPYSTPSEIDFMFDPEPDTSGNFSKRGGSKLAESPESEAQNHREETTLMVVYTSPSDAPSTPKEPTAMGDEDDDYSPPTAFGEPSGKPEVRAREAKYYSSMAPRSQTPTSAQTSSTPSNHASLFNLVAQVTQRGSSYQPQSQQPLVGPTQNWNTLGQQHQQQQQQPQTTPGLNLSKLLSLVQQSQPSQPPPKVAQQAAPSTNNLAAMLASLQQGNQSANQSGFGYNSSNPNPYPGSSDNYSRGQGGSYDDQGGNNELGDHAAWKKKKAQNLDLGKNHPKAKTVACRYWREGKCKKGDDCTFKHDED